MSLLHPARFLVAAAFIVAAGLAQAQPSKPPATSRTVKLTITSSAFPNGGSIPSKHTCDGADVSPALAWSGVPEGTKSFALICDDPDAPLGTWVHWVLWNLPASTTNLLDGVEKSHALPPGTQQGRNDFGNTSYGGPAPPRGKPHRYFFKLHALDTELMLKPGSKKKMLVKAMEGHILAESEWMGTYQRK
jgi:Raf kinase inhibitor-like YbhB/YbcL family protein